MKKNNSIFLFFLISCASLFRMTDGCADPCITPCCPGTLLAFPEDVPASLGCPQKLLECRTPQQLLKLLKEKKFGDQYTIVEQRFFVEVSYIHGQQVLDMLVRVIEFYDNQILMWQEIKKNPTYYSLKQGPWSWFDEIGSKEEIDNYLKRLIGFRSCYCADLSRLHDALHRMQGAFNSSVDYLCLVNAHLLYTVCSVVSPEAAGTFDPGRKHWGLFKNVKESLSFEKRAKQAIKGMRGEPIGHFRRNVMPYVFGCVGAGLVELYLWKNWGKFPVWKQGITSRLHYFYERHLKSKADSFIKIFINPGKKKYRRRKLLGKFSRSAQVLNDGIENNEITFAIIGTVVPFVALRYCYSWLCSVVSFPYSWLTSKVEQYRQMKKTLVRLRVAIDTSCPGDAQSEGMQIYLLRSLEQQCSVVPKRDRERFKSDLFLLGSCVSDQEKSQRIDSMIGPYTFTKV